MRQHISEMRGAVQAPNRTGPVSNPQAGRRPQQSGVAFSIEKRPEPLWNIDEVAAYLDVSKQTIYAWRSSGYGPQGVRVGKHLRWRASTVMDWVKSLEQT